MEKILIQQIMWKAVCNSLLTTSYLLFVKNPIQNFLWNSANLAPRETNFQVSIA